MEQFSACHSSIVSLTMYSMQHVGESEFESDWRAQIPLCDIILTKNFTQSHQTLFSLCLDKGSIHTPF